MRTSTVFVVYGINYVTPTVDTRIATADMALKWRFNGRQRTDFAHVGFL
jgi:hypothetical protein